ncbi:uncharacterized protein I206_105311 [Kwoniella pini CBS 10737]|uniref:Uncharacterized protein n=1 Tax=Kwoniella pini CBS 10737 TaxID=1296096 RepID=A0A1B9I4K3_9TREE|nr:uncharacterized protein I206_03779 [Kwoniella pini CBS 10737]OCF50457.1 hypothetical protein I206_03779 [Kwoniella pini CBS 10737]
MKTTSAIIAASALAGSAYAQANVESIAQTALGYLSTGCITTVLNLTSSSSPLNQCLDGNLLGQIVTSNASIIAPVGTYLDTFCSSQPCSNQTLTAASQQIISGCASDLTKFGITNQTVEWAIAQYPLARDVLCLKTTNPYVGNSTTNATSSAMNTTSLTNSSSSTNSSSNGTFCATSLLTELQSYLGEDLTPTNIATIALGGNSTGLDKIKSIPPTALCDECIFGALSLVEEQYPQLGNITVVGNYTLNQFLETTCNKTTSGSSGFIISNNGTLPTNITESAINSTLTPQHINATSPQTNLTSLTTLLMPSASASGVKASVTSELSAVTASAPKLASAASSLIARAAVTDVKKRWIGQQ